MIDNALRLACRPFVAALLATTACTTAPRQPVSEITTMDQHLSEFVGPQRFAALLTSLFAGLGLLQAALGIYGVTAYSVTRRRREFCIRLAFGARWGDLVKLVVARGTLLRTAGRDR